VDPSYLKLGLTDTASGGLVSEAASLRGLSEGATLLFSPSHPIRKIKAKRGVKDFILITYY